MCWELLKPVEYPNGGLLLNDSSDVAGFDIIQGDYHRQVSLKKLGKRYCIEVLLVLFECLFR